jgi:uncharacterized protein
VSETDAIVEHILTTYDTITVVGASTAASKAAQSVPAHMQRHGWRVIPVNPHADLILGERVYRTLKDVPEQVGLVDVFRPPAETAEVARQAVAAGATALWLQFGIASAQARQIAEAAGLLYVEDRCLLIEQRRLGLDAPRRLPAAGAMAPHRLALRMIEVQGVHETGRPVNAASRSMAGARSVTSCGSANRPARDWAGNWTRTNASACSTRSSGSSAMMPVAWDRSQPCTSRSAIRHCSRSAPVATPSAVAWLC